MTHASFFEAWNDNGKWEKGNCNVVLIGGVSRFADAKSEV